MSFYDLKVNGKIFAVFEPRQFVAKLAKLRAGVLLSTGTGTRSDPGQSRFMKEWGLSFRTGKETGWS
jgi:hypothetical protein